MCTADKTCVQPSTPFSWPIVSCVIASRLYSDPCDSRYAATKPLNKTTSPAFPVNTIHHGGPALLSTSTIAHIHSTHPAAPPQDAPTVIVKMQTSTAGTIINRVAAILRALGTLSLASSPTVSVKSCLHQAPCGALGCTRFKTSTGRLMWCASEKAATLTDEQHTTVQADELLSHDTPQRRPSSAVVKASIGVAAA